VLERWPLVKGKFKWVTGRNAVYHRRQLGLDRGCQVSRGVVHCGRGKLSYVVVAISSRGTEFVGQV
jgi:hypothetical protein